MDRRYSVGGGTVRSDGNGPVYHRLLFILHIQYCICLLLGIGRSSIIYSNLYPGYVDANWVPLVLPITKTPLGSERATAVGDASRSSG